MRRLLVTVQVLGRAFILLAALPFGGFQIAADATAAEANTNKPACYQANSYLVIVREKSDAPGSDFIVRKQTPAANPPPCRFKPAKGDLPFPRQPGDKAYSYLGLYKDRMILDEGTGSVRQLVVVDLQTRILLFEQTAYQTPRMKGNKAYYLADGPVGTKEQCPDLTDDLIASSKLEREMALDLDTLKSTPTGKVECHYEE